MNNLHRFCQLSLMAVLVLTLSWSCKMGGGAGLQDKALIGVPSDAGSVTSFNLENLMKKADFESVKNLEFYQEAIRKAKQEEPIVAEILQDPSLSGIDLSQNAYYFMVGNPVNDKKASGGLVFVLNDPQAFAKLTNQPVFGSPKTIDNVSIVRTESGDDIIAWNQELGFVGKGYFNVEDKVIVKSVFDNDPSSSITQNSHFNAQMSNDHDINTWVNFNPLLKDLPPLIKMQAVMLGLDEDALTDNFMQGHWDFKKGEMEGLVTYFAQPGLTKDFSAFFKNKVSTDFTNKIPGEQLGAAVALGLDLQGFNQVVKEKGMQDVLEGNIKIMGLTADEVAKGFGGDLALAVYPPHGEKETFEVLLATDVKKEAALQKLLDFGLGLNKLSDEGDGLYKVTGAGSDMRGTFNPRRKNAGGDKDGWLLKKDGLVFLASDEALIKKVQSGNFKKAAAIKGISETLGGYVAGGFLNFEGMRQYMKEADVSQLESMTFSAGRENSKASLKLADKSQNSLKAMLLMVNEQFKNKNINVEI